MVLKADQQKMQTLLKDTITLLCKNGLAYSSEFCVEALIGITLDKDEVFLISINEKISASLVSSDGERPRSRVPMAPKMQRHRADRMPNRMSHEEQAGTASADPSVDENKHDNTRRNSAQNAQDWTPGASPTKKRTYSAKEDAAGWKNEGLTSSAVLVKQEPTNNWYEPPPPPPAPTATDSGLTPPNSTPKGPLPEIQTAFGLGWSFGALEGESPRVGRLGLPQPGVSLPSGTDWSAADLNTVLAFPGGGNETPRDSHKRPLSELSSPHSDAGEPQGQRSIYPTSPHDGLPQTTAGKSPKTRHLYSCSLCERTFCSVAGYRDHMRKHSGNYRYVCNECNRGFMQTSHYKSHMAKHQNGNFHAYQMCPETFIQRSELKQQIRLAHSTDMLPGIKSELSVTDSELSVLNSEMSGTNSEMSATNSEMTVMNSEMSATNSDITVINSEMQVT